MGSFINMAGKTFGRLLVLDGFKRGSLGTILWDCLCECGSTISVRAGNLQSGCTKSCGCLQKDLARESNKRNITHGLSKTSQYQAWQDAKRRVLNPDNPKWGDYGGRGIKMCQEWIDSFEAFWKDMGPTWKEGLTIERKDVDGNYCPDNCKWDTESVQGHNRRKLVGCSSQYKGVCFDKSRGKFVARISVKGQHEHLGYFMDEVSAAIAYDNRSEELYGNRLNKTPSNITKEEAKC